MKTHRSSLILNAAFAGLLTGIAARAAQPLPAGYSTSFTSDFAGSLQADKKDAAIEKHACKGLNTCKGNGGGAKKEWGKNSCKGKGGCATDGSKPASIVKK